MKTAFRPGLVDLPEENFEAAYQSVTLPEEFHDFEVPLPALNAIDVVDHFTLNQSRAEDITLTEELESSTLLCDRTLDEEPEALRKKSFLDCSILTSSNSLVAAHCSLSVDGDRTVLQEDTFGLHQDGFGDEEDAADMIELLLRDEQSDLDKDLLDVREDFPLPQDPPENSRTMEPKGAGSTVSDGHLLNETVLLLGEEEGFVLQPVDDTAVNQRKKSKRKRKLLVDVVKELSCSTIYNQLNDCTDILTTLDLAPPTKKTMMWKECGGVDKLLSQPGQPVVHPELQMLFEKCFKSHSLKMRRNEIQREEEVEGARKEQGITEMLRAKEPSSLQDPARDTERRTGNDLVMLMAQSDRNEDDGNSGESREGMVCSESSSLLLPPAGQAAEAQQDESPNELLRNGRESEETRWSKRTLQLLKTLQHLRRSGASSFSFQELCWRSSRKEAAARFCLLLVLKKRSVIQLRQSSPFADITVTPGPLFEAH
ncbi:double-strand-break repair protein rad21-like protein 1 isoform X1 [Pogoniulus pusillus]|uniref:double-strand-break repair protein rad21-like protein 1 isoform X1 n=1 Tax=Pogoniulus pusillus TaxID=488313 RepID=UPI0030B956FE